MHQNSTPSDPTDPWCPAAPEMSRRRLLGVLGAGLGLGSLALARVGFAETRAAELNRPGEALEVARRIRPPTTTTPTTTTPVTTTAPVLDGQIRFPVVVGEDDFCWVSDSFGDCRGSGCSRSHEGVDIMAKHLLPVIAPVAGRLTKQYIDHGASSGAGNGWTLLDESTDVVYKFFHLDHHEDGLATDDEVEAGQVIGYVGNTGTSGVNSDSNYHLHFEYRPNDVPTDSYDLLTRPDHVSWER